MNEHDRPSRVVDARPPLEGGSQRKAVLGLAGGAVAITVMAFALFGGQDQRDIAGLNQPEVVAPDTERLQAYERQVLQQSRAESVEAELVGEQRSMVVSGGRVAVEERGGYGRAGDSAREDVLMRDRESLFAGNVVLTKRPEAERLGQVSSSRDTGRSSAPAAAPMPSLDEVTESVVRAFGAPQATGPLPAPSSSPVAAPGQPNGHPAAGQHRVFEGTVLDAVLTNRLDGSSSAPVNAMVTTSAYAHDGALVVPAGARVLGTTSPVNDFGESRLAVAFHRLLMPNGTSVSLNKFVGLNVRGDYGLTDQVNNHYAATFGAAAAVGLIGGLSQAIGSWWGGRDNTTIILGGAGDAASNSAAQVMGRFLNRSPTVTIREGHRLKVYLTSDLDLPEYKNDH